MTSPFRAYGSREIQRVLRQEKRRLRVEPTVVLRNLISSRLITVEVVFPVEVTDSFNGAAETKRGTQCWYDGLSLKLLCSREPSQHQAESGRLTGWHPGRAASIIDTCLLGESIAVAGAATIFLALSRVQ